MHRARDSGVAGDEQVRDGARCAVQLRYIWRRDLRQLGVCDDLASERGQSERGAVAAAAIEGLLDVAVGSQA